MQATLAMPAATELLPLIPELVLVGAAFALLMLDLFLKDSQRVVTHVLSVATLLVVGGLYGNPFAMDAVQAMFVKEQERLGEGGRVGMVFNGDMHWFDRTAEEFARVEAGAEKYIPMVGNVEAEVRRTEDIGVGCGCAYPDCTDDASVSRSNRIHHMMKEEIGKHPDLIAKLKDRPAHMVAQVGDWKAAKKVMPWAMDGIRKRTPQATAAEVAAADAALEAEIVFT